MHHEHDVARRQGRQPGGDASHLIGEALSAGRPIACRRTPELSIGSAEFHGEIVMPPSGPRAEILLPKGGLFDRFQAESQRRLERAARGTAKHRRIRRQLRLQSGQARPVAEERRCVGVMDDAARPITGACRMSQRRASVLMVRYSARCSWRAMPGARRGTTGPPSRRFVRRRRARHRSGRRSADGRARPCRHRSPWPEARRRWRR